MAYSWRLIPGAKNMIIRHWTSFHSGPIVAKGAIVKNCLATSRGTCSLYSSSSHVPVTGTSIRWARDNENMTTHCRYEHIKQLHNTSKTCMFEDRETKSVTVWSNIKQLRASPVPALTLGLCGLVPFIAAPAWMISAQVYMPQLAFAQLAYGAATLSFLGGIRWGFTLPEENPIQPDWLNLGYSVLPSLVAWCGLLLPNPLNLFTLMSGLTVVGYFDMAMYGYPPWFKGLRFLLSFVAVLSLWTTFMCALLLKSKADTNKTLTEQSTDVE